MENVMQDKVDTLLDTLATAAKDANEASQAYGNDLLGAYNTGRKLGEATAYLNACRMVREALGGI